VGRGLLLAVDVGNSNVKIGTFEGEELIAHWRLETHANRLCDEYAALIGVLLQHRGLSFQDIGGMSLSSTVPALINTFRELATRYLPEGTHVTVVSAFAETGITVDIENPREMGADRIVDALAASRLYSLPAIIVDFGTATTFDAVDANGRLLGTAIAPGFATAMDGLFNRAARLARIEFSPPESAIGRNTSAALRSGWLYGYVGLVEGLVTRIKTELGGQATVIATGGLAEEVVNATKLVDVVDPMLTLKGLRLYYELNPR
jgi:type III pantothenate kinase